MNKKEENKEFTDEKSLNENDFPEERKTIPNDQLNIENKKLEKNIEKNVILSLEKKIESLEKRERDIILRLKAEIENMRKRNEQEITKIHRFALENFITELLPVIDNLERALSTICKEDTKLDATVEGLELTLKSFLDTIKKFGIDIIEQKNIPFNPEIHQAMTVSESETHKPNHIINILQKGYILNGRLIRPAMVIVSKEKEITTKQSQ